MSNWKVSLYRPSSSHRLRVLTALFVAVFLAVSACAENQAATSKPSEQTDSASSELISSWIGTYDGLGRACESHAITIYESKFSWMDCKQVPIRTLSSSKREFAFEVDSKAKCSWAGKVVSLKTHAPLAPLAIDVYAHDSVGIFESDVDKKHYLLNCAYSKRH